MSNGDFEWNQSNIAKLTELWAAGLSTAEIGRRMKTSKNAVVGKAHRLNLPARPTPIQGHAGAYDYSAGRRAAVLTHEKVDQICLLAAPLRSAKTWESTHGIAKKVGIDARRVAQAVRALITAGRLPEACSRDSFLTSNGRVPRQHVVKASLANLESLTGHHANQNTAPAAPPIDTATAAIPAPRPDATPPRRDQPKLVGRVTAGIFSYGPATPGGPGGALALSEQLATNASQLANIGRLAPSEKLFDDLERTAADRDADQEELDVRAHSFVANLGPRRGCDWPMWGNDCRPTHQYCGKPHVLGQPYCPEHFARAFTKHTADQAEQRFLKRLRCESITIASAAA